MLDEVLQIHTVFSNVSKGTVAKKTELAEAFPGMAEADIVLEILAKGELQVGKQEREQAQEASFREIAGYGPCVEALMDDLFQANQPNQLTDPSQHRGGQMPEPGDTTAIHGGAD